MRLQLLPAAVAVFLVTAVAAQQPPQPEPPNPVRADYTKYDRLELRVEIVKHRGAIWREKGTALVDGQVVAEAEFMAMLVDRKKGS